MHFPELCAFKFYFWKRTVIGYPELARQQFTGVEPDKEALELSKKIIDLYSQVDSTEIWNEENINCSIRQIDFCKQSNLFADNAILLKLYSQLEEMVNHLELQAETGLKLLYNQPETANSSKFDMYINEYLIGDNTVYVRSTDRQFAFLNHTGLNFMSCQDDNFCDYIFSKLQSIVRKSTHIGIVGEKERRVFFNLLREKIRVKKNSVT
jgi:hypothetical protein